MFEKKEDQLFDYAFGELDAHEAQVFEASLLNDEAAKFEAEFLRSLKGDLVSLRDIPEMQFSKERLRSAILEQGLKPKRPGIQWANWLLAPSAVACVMALGLVLMNRMSPQGETKYVPGPNTALGGSKPAPFNPLTTKSNEPMVAINNKPKSGPDVRSIHSANSKGFSQTSIRTHSSNRSLPEETHVEGSVSTKEFVTTRNGDVAMAFGKISARDTATAGSVTAVRKANVNVKGFDSVPAGLGGGGIRDMNQNFGGGGVGRGGVLPEADYSNDAFKVAFANVSAKSGEEAKLIVIDSEQDSGVGAAVATEVNNTTNVVIGG